MAPAPIRSSTAGRSERSPWASSGQRSPAGTTATRRPSRAAAAATARALRRQPASVGVVPTRALSVAPLGEGMTSFVPGGTLNMAAADSR